MNIFTVGRAITYAALFVGLLFIYLPGRLLTWSGIARPEPEGAAQIAGMIVGGVGTGIALWCIFAFVFVGKGTPAPVDPPRRLVIRGPFCAKSDVHWRRARPCRPGNLLRNDISRALCRVVLARSAYLRGRLRRTDFASNLWTKIRRLLRPC